jgi:hypothetical protein
MKTKIMLLLFVIAIAGCTTSKEGCAASKYQGPKYKTTKFSWYKG